MTVLQGQNRPAVLIEGGYLSDMKEAKLIANAGYRQKLAEAVARRHAAFERIHPFLDGNGRVGRLLMNLILVRLGYPPAIIQKRERPRYLEALRRADAADAGPLGEMVARAILDDVPLDGSAIEYGVVEVPVDVPIVLACDVVGHAVQHLDEVPAITQAALPQSEAGTNADFAIDAPGRCELPDFVPSSREGWTRILPGLLELKGGLDGFFMARLVRTA